MRNFFAILKDSFREAIDTKVFYVMLGLSGLLILLIGSVSFRPVPVQEQLEGLAQTLNWVLRLQAQGKPMRCEIRDFHQDHEDREPWQRDYRFKFAVIFPDAMTATMLSRQLRRDFRQLLREGFYWLDNLEIEDVKTTDPLTVELLVSSQGTKITDARGWTHEPSLFFGALSLTWFRASLGYMVYWIENRLVNTIGAWITILIGVVVTAFFIPNMLRKGTIDLLLAKPIYRSTLLLFKYVGGLMFLFLNALVIVVGIWLALGLRSGIWAEGFLLTVLILTYFFAILYTVSTLFGVLTRSPIVAILMTCAAWLVLWIVGFTYDKLEEWKRPPDPRRPSINLRTKDDEGDQPSPEQAMWQPPGWLTATVSGLHFVLPRTSDLDTLTTQLLSRSILSEAEIHQRRLDRYPAFSWTESLTVSAVFIAVVLGLACWRFATKDF
jgi:ABC-type transport system involved in multi-copper enzyme maturation permease subunit